MVVDIKMCRFENVPWGFRLVGGADYEVPLTVVKVTKGSIAEEAGLREGDVIVRINDTATSPLSHDEADKLIRGAGNVFFIGVQREGDDEEVPKIFPVLNIERPPTPQDFSDLNGRKSPIPRQLAFEEEEKPEVLKAERLSSPKRQDRSSSVLSENTEIKLFEEEIAAVLSGESEVLKEHNVMGVNFYRIFPKPGVCMTSDVLATLNEDATKTKLEKDKEKKKWSTFLVKPDRPIPKSKEAIEAERRATNAYKVKIVKSAPKSRSPSPMPRTSETVVQAELKATEKQPTPPKVEEVEEAPLKDSELPNLEEVKIVIVPPTEENNTTQVEFVNEERNADEVNEGNKQHIGEYNNGPSQEQNTDESVIISDETTNTTATEASMEQQREKSEEEIALESQLADVQRQLAALSSLPSTIQATLDAVTKQLATLLPALQSQTAAQKQEVQEIPAVHGLNLVQIKENVEVTKTEDAPKSEPDCIQEDIVLAETTTPMPEENINMDASNLDDIKKQESKQNKEDMKQMEAEQSVKKQKRNDVIEELEEQLERKTNPRRSKRAFGPLTPSSERPLVLPGGRRWYRPKDAYNDEFIAETLSAQAELITGTTLGVNFMKYQKPERKIDFNRSEVYKIIHHMDRQPVRGIEVRPPVVPAEVDIRKE
ncbi:titin homolog isoform X2 [Eurosta solidaginis]|uniref:titin homolog isoform X2 n=1 Tax=Eurosta solidaginis TaxID=178769 RepID=UPI0035312CAD